MKSFETIKFETQVNETDFMLAYALHCKNPEKKMNKYVSFSVIFLLISINIVLIQTNLWAGVICLVTFYSMLLYFTWFGKRSMRHEFKNNLYLKSPVTITVDNEGISFLGKYHQTMLVWENIYRFVENDDFLLIYLSPNQFIIFPKSQIDNDYCSIISERLKSKFSVSEI